MTPYINKYMYMFICTVSWAVRVHEIQSSDDKVHWKKNGWTGKRQNIYCLICLCCWQRIQYQHPTVAHLTHTLAHKSLHLYLNAFCRPITHIHIYIYVLALYIQRMNNNNSSTVCAHSITFPVFLSLLCKLKQNK